MRQRERNWTLQGDRGEYRGTPDEAQGASSYLCLVWPLRLCRHSIRNVDWWNRHRPNAQCAAMGQDSSLPVDFLDLFRGRAAEDCSCLAAELKGRAGEEAAGRSSTKRGHRRDGSSPPPSAHVGAGTTSFEAEDGIALFAPGNQQRERLDCHRAVLVVCDRLFRVWISEHVSGSRSVGNS